MNKWRSTKYPGIRFYYHKTRKHGIKFDQYFAIRYQRDGKRVEEGLGWSSEGMTLEKAAKELGDLKEAARLGKADATRLKEKREVEKKRREKKVNDALTFGDFFEKTYYPIAKRSKKPESYLTEMGHFKNWIEPAIGAIPLFDLRPLHLEKLKKTLLEKKKSARTIEYIFSTVRGTWNTARKHRVIDGDPPTRAVKLPRIENKRVRFLSPEEAGDLLAYLKTGNRTIHDMAFLSLFSGMRFGEVKSLKWGAVDLERGFMTIFDAKGSKTRTAFMTTEVREMLAGRTKGNPENLVFPTLDGREYADTPIDFRDAVKELELNKGITDQRQKVVFHTLRHSYASWLAEAGTDIYTVGKLLGHSTVQMSARYAHLSPGAMQEAVKRLPSLTTRDQAGQGKVFTLKK